MGLRPGTLALRAKLPTPAAMVAVADRLRSEHGAHISVRCGAFRISPYVNTTEEEVAQLLAGLAHECCDDPIVRARFDSGGGAGEGAGAEKAGWTMVAGGAEGDAAAPVQQGASVSVAGGYCTIM